MATSPTSSSPGAERIVRVTGWAIPKKCFPQGIPEKSTFGAFGGRLLIFCPTPLATHFLQHRSVVAHAYTYGRSHGSKCLLFLPCSSLRAFRVSLLSSLAIALTHLVSGMSISCPIIHIHMVIHVLQPCSRVFPMNSLPFVPETCHLLFSVRIRRSSPRGCSSSVPAWPKRWQAEQKDTAFEPVRFPANTLRLELFRA